MIGRARYHSAADSMHCKDLAPADADEPHKIAGKLRSDPRSEALGWQVLFEAPTGLRTNEALSLRTDAGPDEPGGLTEEGRSRACAGARGSARITPTSRSTPD